MARRPFNDFNNPANAEYLALDANQLNEEELNYELELRGLDTEGTIGTKANFILSALAHEKQITPPPTHLFQSPYEITKDLEECEALYKVLADSLEWLTINDSTLIKHIHQTRHLQARTARMHTEDSELKARLGKLKRRLILIRLQFKERRFAEQDTIEISLQDNSVLNAQPVEIVTTCSEENVHHRHSAPLVSTSEVTPHVQTAPVVTAVATTRSNMLTTVSTNSVHHQPVSVTVNENHEALYSANRMMRQEISRPVIDTTIDFSEAIGSFDYNWNFDEDDSRQNATRINNNAIPANENTVIPIMSTRVATPRQLHPASQTNPPVTRDNIQFPMNASQMFNPYYQPVQYQPPMSMPYQYQPWNQVPQFRQPPIAPPTQTLRTEQPIVQNRLRSNDEESIESESLFSGYSQRSRQSRRNGNRRHNNNIRPVPVNNWRIQFSGDVKSTNKFDTNIFQFLKEIDLFRKAANMTEDQRCV